MLFMIQRQFLDLLLDYNTDCESYRFMKDDF